MPYRKDNVRRIDLSPVYQPESCAPTYGRDPALGSLTSKEDRYAQIAHPMASLVCLVSRERCSDAYEVAAIRRTTLGQG